MATRGPVDGRPVGAEQVRRVAAAHREADDREQRDRADDRDAPRAATAAGR